jgi:hypothetical protein
MNNGFVELGSKIVTSFFDSNNLTVIMDDSAPAQPTTSVGSAFVWFIPRIIFTMLGILIYKIPSLFMSYCLALLSKRFSFTLQLSSL